jgi:ligand-binding sensor domain-containing protein
LKKAVYFVVFLSLVSAVSAWAQTLNFRNYTVNSGLANSTVYYITQDKKGFIWFATESGVNRYDGQNFETFTMDDGLSDNEVLQIREDSEGRIWFLTLNGKLSYYRDGKFHNERNTPILAKAFCKASFVSFFEDSQRRLWFSTNQREMAMIDGDKVTIFSSRTQPLTNSFVAENGHSELLILNKTRFYTFRKGQFQELNSAYYPLTLSAVNFDKQKKSILFISKDGLIEFKNGRSVVTRKLPENILNSGVSNFFIDDDKSIWISTAGNGTYRIGPHQDEAGQHLLKGKYISHSLRDKDGNIWIATIGNGIYMLPRSARGMKHYTVGNGLLYSSIYSILRTPEKHTILGLRNGNLTIITPKGTRYQQLKQSASAYNPIKKLTYDPKNKSIWFASNNFLGEIASTYSSVRYLTERDNLTYALKSFSISQKGKLAIALASGVDILEDKNAPLVFESPNLTNPSHHFPSRAYTVFYDSQERLWFSNINGLQCYDGDSLLTLYTNTPQFRQRITDIIELPDKTILCATYGFGLYQIKDFKLVKTITTDNGLASNICKKVFYAQNYIWAVTGKGISRISPHFRQIDNFQKENGLLSNEINDAIVDQDSVYVASNTGLSVFKADATQASTTAIPLVLNQVFVNNQKLNLSKEIRLPYSWNNIVVNYIGIDYSNPERVIYKYRLHEESKWNITDNTSIEFSSLRPRTYRLEIQAKGLNTDWSKPIIFSFTIEPPLWQKPWFILLAILIIGPLVFFLINNFYKNKRLKEQEKLLAKTKILALEQQALQAMMNPHFIFNVMNSIQHFINTKDTVMANQLLTGFARLIRKNLDICNKSYISIEEELSYLTLYLSLEKLRFGEKMSYEITVADEIDKEETFIPSMLLQPFVENAIWHGIMPKETPGHIWIHINLKDQNMLDICIEDDGIGIDNSLKLKSNDHISRGMELTQERINLLNKFDAPIQLKVQSTVPNGTKVTIQIPTEPFTH